MVLQTRDTWEVAAEGLAGVAVVALVVIGVTVLSLMTAALVSAFFDGDLTGGGKLLWALFIVWVPLLGAVAWFVVGKKGHLNRFLGIDRGRGRHTVPVSRGTHSSLRREQNGLSSV